MGSLCSLLFLMEADRVSVYVSVRVNANVNGNGERERTREEELMKERVYR